MKPFRSFLTHLVLLSFCCTLSARVAEPRQEPQTQAPDEKVATPPQSPGSSRFMIPGPQKSFLRLAGISQKVSPDEVLPMLSRNVFTQGYEGNNRPTEFLNLLRRYVVQARELSSLASQSGMVLRVSTCEEATPLLRILGYRLRPACGDSNLTLTTADPERAFLTIDSGFPLYALEQALRSGKSFEYPYVSDSVPVLFNESDWTRLSKANINESSKDLIDTFLNDSSVARLYWAISRMDASTSQSLVHSVGLASLLPYAGLLDFYGRELFISNGAVMVPGGPSAAPDWAEMVGADPANPGKFVLKLLAKDRGWMAAYFDVLSRPDNLRKAYFTESHRLRLFYRGFRTPDPAQSAARGSFRPAPWLVLFATRLQLDHSGQPLIPGGLQEWNDILFHGVQSGLVRKWAKQNEQARDSDHLIKIMFALSRAYSETTPLQIYMALSELDSRRSPENRLAPATVRLLARRFVDYSDQYRIFSEFPALSDASIALFMQVAHGLNNFSSSDRGNAMGIFQANVGLWQILSREGQIRNSQFDESWQQVIKPFTSVRTSAQLYEAGRSSLAEMMRFATGKPIISQDTIIELLAGPAQSTPAGKQMHQEAAARIRAVLDDQRLVSLDTLTTVGDALNAKARGKEPEEFVLLMAAETRSFQMPRPIFTTGEKEEWAAGIYNNHHTDRQINSDLPKILKSSSVSPHQLEEARGHLASFLRDTLVGLNYAYYEPPAAEALHNNPLLVRSHDFAGDTVEGVKSLWQASQVFGEGLPAGGGAHLVGSLADLPYILATLEQDFISPESVQALIWRQVAPELLMNSSLPRYWDVSPVELHAVALSQRMGEELLTQAAKDDELRSKVLTILSNRLRPPTQQKLQEALRAGNVSEAIRDLMPADAYHLALQFREENPDWHGEARSATEELLGLSQQHPELVNRRRLFHDFGTPHPVTAQSYGLETIGVGLMPAFSGHASRFLAESWDSPNLYWARLADERGYPPVMLNEVMPELTRIMVQKIFATDFEDWPALQRAMREAGNELQAYKDTSRDTTTAMKP